MATRRNKRFDKRALVRLTSWGTGAAVALMVAVLTSFSSTGSQRMGFAVAALTQGAEPQPVTVARLTPRPSDTDGERRRLNEAIRLLAADRDRLLTRVASIERNLDDMTGSIKRQAEQPPLPQISGPRTETTASLPEIPATAPPATAAARPTAATVSPFPQDVPEWIANRPDPWPNTSVAFEMAPAAFDAPTQVASAPTAPATAEPPPAAPAATRTEFGVDIGGGSNLDEVRALWNAARAQHTRLLGGLRPIVSIRGARTGAVDMRLIVGPLANASAAAKLCASLGAADVMCSTRPFEGERLAVR